MDSTEKAMVVAAGVALVGLFAAVSMTALQALADPSGTVVVSIGVIVASGIVGMMGVAAFGLLWLLKSNKRS
jgi:hypothetical protein